MEYKPQKYLNFTDGAPPSRRNDPEKNCQNSALQNTARFTPYSTLVYGAILESKSPILKHLYILTSGPPLAAPCSRMHT